MSARSELIRRLFVPLVIPAREEVGVVPEMVERVARAIVQHHMLGGEYVASDGSRHDMPPWEGWVTHARAVLGALRIPTEAMQVAGHMVRNDPETGLPTVCGTDEIYTAMIDAALRGPDGA